MICHRCLYRLRSSTPSLTRFASSLNPPPPTAPRGPPSGTHEGPPAATSTSAAQPFSTPFTPKVPPITASASSKDDPPIEEIVSSLPAGTPMRGLGYFKNKEPPIAKEVWEYPGWLWGLLDKKGNKEGGGEGAGEGEGEIGDIYGKSKKQRRIALRAHRKAALLHPKDSVPKIPIEEQSIDLAGGSEDGEEAMEARKELTRAMRAKRRKGIKERNFLTGMR